MHCLQDLTAGLGQIRPCHAAGRVTRAARGLLDLRGLAASAAMGDRVLLQSAAGPVGGEVVSLGEKIVQVMPEGDGQGVRVGDVALHLGAPRIAPSARWLGRIVDANGLPLDDRPLAPGDDLRALRAAPPPATSRRALGPRLTTGHAVFDTMLPIVRGQRIGLFAGAGVGKSRLLGSLGRQMEADVTVIALIGERGRELREFVERALGPEGLSRAVIVVATSDAPALVRRRALWTAMTVAEYFRDAGKHVLFLADSITRFAEAHREVALACGEGAALRGYPPSVAHAIMALAERAGPGRADGRAAGTMGDITALLAVLVAGSDIDEPVADILRGTLDGHILLDRSIAERGRFPAVDVLHSVSRCLPDCASAEENALISLARRRLASHDDAALMIQSGLYAPGSDPELDAAVSAWPSLDAFVGSAADGTHAAFAELARCLGKPPPAQEQAEERSFASS